MADGVEVVRGGLDQPRAEEILSFWGERGALTGEAAQRRLPEIVCLLRRRGEVVGASSVYPAEVALIGARRFWIYRSLLDSAVSEQAPAMISATFQALAAEFDRSSGSPIGLCVLIPDPAEWSPRPEAVWAEPPLLYAGYLDDGRQVRIGYFAGARIGPEVASAVASAASPPGPGGGYRIELFAERDDIGPQEVVDLWLREGALPPAEAERRVAELLLIATDPAGRPVGVCTTYLQRSDQLRTEVWYTRVFVAAAHRRSGLALELAVRARDHLAQGFASAVEQRGIGMIFEVESDILKRFFPDAIWPRTQFAFIAEGPGGSHTRVYYFPGARAPEPDHGSA